MIKHFVYVKWDDYDISNCLINFATLAGAKSWILKNYKQNGKITLIRGTEVHFEYNEEIKIKSQ